MDNYSLSKFSKFDLFGRYYLYEIPESGFQIKMQYCKRFKEFTYSEYMHDICVDFNDPLSFTAYANLSLNLNRSTVLYVINFCINK